MKLVRLSLMVSVCLILWTFRSSAGVLMVNASTSSDRPDAQVTSKVFIDKDRVRLEQGNDQIALFRQDKGVFWMIDLKNKTYTEISRQDLQKMKSQMDEASRQVEEQMKNLPPDQRQMMEQMMAGKMSKKAPQISYRKVAAGETVSQWVCDKYEGTREGNKQSDVWTTDWKNLGLQPEDFNALKEMGEFFQELARGQDSFYQVGDQADEHHYAGVPIKTIGYAGDRIANTQELKQISSQDLDASLFDLPSGYAKQDLGWERGKE